MFEDAIQSSCVLAATKAANKGGDLDQMFASFGFDPSKPPHSLLNPTADDGDFKTSTPNTNFLYHLQKVDQEFERVNRIADHGILLPGHSLKVLSWAGSGRYRIFSVKRERRTSHTHFSRTIFGAVLEVPSCHPQGVPSRFRENSPEQFPVTPPLPTRAIVRRNKAVLRSSSPVQTGDSWIADHSLFTRGFVSMHDVPRCCPIS